MALTGITVETMQILNDRLYKGGDKTKHQTRKKRNAQTHTSGSETVNATSIT